MTKEIFFNWNLNLVISTRVWSLPFIVLYKIGIDVVAYNFPDIFALISWVCFYKLIIDP